MNATSLIVECSAGYDAVVDGVVGIAAIVGWLAPTTITLIALVFGYLTKCLPGLEHTEVDNVLLHQSEPDQNGPAREARRRQFLERFLPALADSLLVVCLAYVIGLFFAWKEISVYSLFVVAWIITPMCMCAVLATARYFPKYLRVFWPRFRIAVTLLVILGIGSLEILALYAFASSTAIYQQAGAITDDQLPKSLKWELRVSCVLSNMPTAPHSLTCLFCLILIPVYFLNILCRIYGGPRQHSSSFVYRGILKLFGGEPDTFDDYEQRWKKLDKWIKSVDIEWLHPLLRVLSYIDTAYFAVKTCVFYDIPWLLFIFISIWVQLGSFWTSQDSPMWHYGFHFGFPHMVMVVSQLSLIFSAARAFVPLEETERKTASENSSPQSASNVSPDLNNANLPTQESSPNPAISKKAAEVPGVKMAIRVQATLYLVLVLYAAVIASGPWFDTDWAFSAPGALGVWYFWGFCLEILDLMGRLIRVSWNTCCRVRVIICACAHRRDPGSSPGTEMGNMGM